MKRAAEMQPFSFPLQKHSSHLLSQPKSQTASYRTTYAQGVKPEANQQ